MTLAVRGVLVPRYSWGTYVKRTFIAAAAILAFTASGHADELSDIQAQAKQLREQNLAMQKRLADLSAEPVGGTPQATAAYFHDEVERWKNVITAAHVTLD